MSCRFGLCGVGLCCCPEFSASFIDSSRSIVGRECVPAFLLIFLHSSSHPVHQKRVVSKTRHSMTKWGSIQFSWGDGCSVEEKKTVLAYTGHLQMMQPLNLQMLHVTVSSLCSRKTLSLSDIPVIKYHCRPEKSTHNLEVLSLPWLFTPLPFLCLVHDVYLLDLGQLPLSPSVWKGELVTPNSLLWRKVKQRNLLTVLGRMETKLLSRWNNGNDV